MIQQDQLFTIETNEATHPATQQRRPALAKKSNRRKRKKEPEPPGLCLVCTAPTESGKYCEKHPATLYRMIPCEAPGCHSVTPRFSYHQGFYFRCSEHQAFEPEPRQPIDYRALVMNLIETRRRALVEEKKRRPQLPPRPPNNIGHYR